jgi:hypothetical protein
MVNVDFKTTCSDVTVRAIITQSFGIEWWDDKENRKVYEEEMKKLKYIKKQGGHT